MWTGAVSWTSSGPLRRHESRDIARQSAWVDHLRERHDVALLHKELDYDVISNISPLITHLVKVRCRER